MTFKELRQQSGMNMTQFSKYFGIPYRTIQNWELGQRQCPAYLLDLMKYKLENEDEKENKTVFVVLAGEDCEGAEIQAVFANENDAVDYLDTHFSLWKKVSPTERRSGCDSAFIEEWDVS